MTLTVAHFGEEGAYASEAAAKLYPAATLVPYHSVSDVMRAVTRREADYGVLPIENSLAGVVPETYDALAHAPLAIVDEAVLPVPHVLVGLPQTNIDALTRVHSHPMALSQCRRFLSSLPDTLPEVAPEHGCGRAPRRRAERPATGGHLVARCRPAARAVGAAERRLRPRAELHAVRDGGAAHPHRPRRP